MPASKRLAAQMKGSARNLWNGKSMTFERQSLSPARGAKRGTLRNQNSASPVGY